MTYEIVAEDGPPHERTFEVVAMVEGESLARGSGRSKKDAEQAAAEAALDDRLTRVGHLHMHLSSITLKGFKSFPDRTRLTFSPGVSVIVGPNGSGKSNITDAVLWAMGEQSPLAVRGQSMQDVIFAGAHGVQARSEAEVEVVLDNASGGAGSAGRRGLDRAAAQPRGGGRVPHQRRQVPAHRRDRDPLATPAWARRCTPSSPRAASRRSSPPSRATGGC